MKIYDVVIIGGGIIGLWCAKELANQNKSVLIIDEKTIYHTKAGSNGITRSLRQDYDDSLYAELSIKTTEYWKDFEQEIKSNVFIKTGCLNLYSKALSKSLFESYAFNVGKVLQSCNISYSWFNEDQVKKEYPFFKVNSALFQYEAGVLLPKRIKNLILDSLSRYDCKIFENKTINKISRGKDNKILLDLSDEQVKCRKIIIASGTGTNKVLSAMSEFNRLELPLKSERPIANRMYYPTKQDLKSFTNMPIFAYLDFGIYGHPMIDNETSGIKIANYKPPKGVKREYIIDDFVCECIPSLSTVEYENVIDTDLGSYQITPDGDFIMGLLPGTQDIAIACGWNGTGFKFAPWVAKTLSRLLTDPTVENVPNRFAVNRFVS